MDDLVMYQVSTLQALAMGYTRAVISVEELLLHGDTGLGTYENIDGEMIIADGVCYRAKFDGSAEIAEQAMGVPFAAASFLHGSRCFELGFIPDISSLKSELTVKIEENFGLNSMHMVRIDGVFTKVSARSEHGYRSQHVSMKSILEKTQRSFEFRDISGTLVCVYFPDYMDGINTPGWHVHFLSEDRTHGGHVFDLVMKQGSVRMNKISRIEIQLPNTPAFDTYSLKEASQDEIRHVEQGKKKTG